MASVNAQEKSHGPKQRSPGSTNPETLPGRKVMSQGSQQAGQDHSEKDSTMQRFLASSNRLEDITFVNASQDREDEVDFGFILVDSPVKTEQESLAELDRYMAAITCADMLEQFQ